MAETELQKLLLKNEIEAACHTKEKGQVMCANYSLPL